MSCFKVITSQTVKLHSRQSLFQQPLFRQSVSYLFPSYGRVEGGRRDVQQCCDSSIHLSVPLALPQCILGLWLLQNTNKTPHIGNTNSVNSLHVGKPHRGARQGSPCWENKCLDSSAWYMACKEVFTTFLVPAELQHLHVPCNLNR